MAKKSFIVTEFSGLSMGNFLIVVRTIITQMTTNPNFPEPPYPMDQLDARLKELEVFVNTPREQLSQAQRDTRDEIRKEIELKISINGTYVVLLYPGNKSMQLNSGYPPAKDRTTNNDSPETPTNVSVRKGDKSGEVILNCKKRPGTKALEIQYWLNEPDSPVMMLVSTSSRNIKISGLRPGGHYMIKVRAIGKTNVEPSDWSNTVEIWVS